MIVDTEEWVVVAVFIVVVKVEPGVRESVEFKSMGLDDKDARPNAPYIGAKSSSLVMVSLKYVGERNAQIRVPLRGNG